MTTTISISGRSASILSSNHPCTEVGFVSHPTVLDLKLPYASLTPTAMPKPKPTIEPMTKPSRKLPLNTP